MCGIVGVISNYSNGFDDKEVNAFTTMLFLDTLRGLDSTGVFALDRDNNIEIHKAAVNGGSFVADDIYKQFKTTLMYDGTFVVGHNRAATKGTINDDNAHPFWAPMDDGINHIILVQNGTFRSDHKKIADTEVDSAAIAQLFAEEEDIEKAVNSFDASYSLVWYNSKLQTLNMLRNSERPLWLAPNGTTGLLFASEPRTIQYAIAGENIKTEALKELPVDTLYSYSFKTPGFVKLDTTKISIHTKKWYGGTGFHSLACAYGFQEEGEETEIVSPKLPTTYPNGKAIPLASYILKEYRGFLMDSEEAYSTQRALESWLAPVGSNNVEVLDYREATETLEPCTRWYVIATPISTEPINAIIYWFEDGTKEQMDRYIKDPYKRCNIYTPRAEGTEEKYVCAFGYAAKDIT